MVCLSPRRDRGERSQDEPKSPKADLLIYLAMQATIRWQGPTRALNHHRFNTLSISLREGPWPP
jgi:hypothetical protein